MARRASRNAAAPAGPAREETLVIRAVGAKGDGVAHGAAGDVYAPLVLPGETVRLGIVGDRGEVREIVAPSPERVAAPCPHFGRCGGCALQHWREDAYRAWKRAIVVEALRRAGLADVDVRPVLATPTATRRRAVLAVKRVAGGVLAGFKARASHAIGPIDGCLILHPALRAFVSHGAALAAQLPAAWTSAAFAATLCENGIDLDIAPMTKGGSLSGDALQRFAAAMAPARVIRASVHGDTAIERAAPVVRFAGVVVTPPPGGFLQASVEGETAIAAMIEKESAGARRALDLFSGCGSFSFPLARTASVDAYDGDAAAIAALDRAARVSPLKPVKATRRDLFARPLAVGEMKGFDLAVFDPPRAGAAAQAAELARADLATIVAVSCNPATFARDAAILSQGGWRLEHVTPIDQFVYSPHVELVGVLRRR